MKNNLELQKYLSPGESLIWAERPDPWFFARPTFMIYIIALPWTVFTFLWLYEVSGGFEWPGETAPPIPWWLPWVGIWTGIILLAAGLWMLSAPFWIWKQGKRTINALTTQRALIFDARRPKKIQALDLLGRIDFKIVETEEAVSDINVITESGKSVVFRAVRQPQQMVGQLISKLADAPKRD